MRIHQNCIHVIPSQLLFQIENERFCLDVDGQSIEISHQQTTPLQRRRKKRTRYSIIHPQN